MFLLTPLLAEFQVLQDQTIGANNGRRSIWFGGGISPRVVTDLQFSAIKAKYTKANAEATGHDSKLIIVEKKDADTVTVTFIAVDSASADALIAKLNCNLPACGGIYADQLNSKLGTNGIATIKVNTLTTAAKRQLPGMIYVTANISFIDFELWFVDNTFLKIISPNFSFKY